MYQLLATVLAGTEGRSRPPRRGWGREGVCAGPVRSWCYCQVGQQRSKATGRGRAGRCGLGGGGAAHRGALARAPRCSCRAMLDSRAAAPCRPLSPPAAQPGCKGCLVTTPTLVAFVVCASCTAPPAAPRRAARSQTRHDTQRAAPPAAAHAQRRLGNRRNRRLGDLAAVGDHDPLGGAAGAAAVGLHLAHDGQGGVVLHVAKHNVLAVQPRGLRGERRREGWVSQQCC